jgi:hypothetical protein
MANMKIIIELNIDTTYVDSKSDLDAAVFMALQQIKELDDLPEYLYDNQN